MGEGNAESSIGHMQTSGKASIERNERSKRPSITRPGTGSSQLKVTISRSQARLLSDEMQEMQDTVKDSLTEGFNIQIQKHPDEETRIRQERVKMSKSSVYDKLGHELAKVGD